MLAGVDEGEGILRWIRWMGFVPEEGIRFAGVGGSTMVKVLVVAVFAAVGVIFA